MGVAIFRSYKGRQRGLSVAMFSSYRGRQRGLRVVGVAMFKKGS